jgi:hypothetical protein
MAHDVPVSAILYPVAASADEALSRPKGRAARQREATALGGGAVRFVTEEAGPAFATREALLDAFVGRLDDPRPGRATIAPEDHYLGVAQRAQGAALAPVEPVFRSGRRWPPPPARRVGAVFRLAISYWRILGADEAAPDDQARDLRRRVEAAALEPGRLRALAQQPLRPVKPQQPLDVGLFEAPAPEAPHILIPDE